MAITNPKHKSYFSREYILTSYGLKAFFNLSFFIRFFFYELLVPNKMSKQERQIWNMSKYLYFYYNIIKFLSNIWEFKYFNGCNMISEDAHKTTPYNGWWMHYEIITSNNKYLRVLYEYQIIKEYHFPPKWWKVIDYIFVTTYYDKICR